MTTAATTQVLRAASLLLTVACVVSVRADERVDHQAYWKIRQEATTNSQIMRTLQVFTDVHGPRLTGSPNLKAAGEWAVSQMERWGLKRGRLEPWDWGFPGWVNERLSAHIVSPVNDALVVEALGWTPGTNGPVRAGAVQLPIPPRATRDELAAHLEPMAPKVKGKIVLVGAPVRVAVSFNPQTPRFEDREVETQMAGPARGAGPPGAAAAQPARGQGTPSAPAVLTAAQRDEMLFQFLLSNDAVARVNDAGRDHGQIRAFANRTYDPAAAVPTVVMRNEDYGRIWRLIDAGRPVELELDIVNRMYPEGRTAYNALAEIPGTDKASEVVMLGGHLDSWHAATGATDNGIGCAVIMEAARILSAIGVKPRRTIRVALWSGEEQGMRGSRAYVREHFGTFEEPKAPFHTLAGYVNLDHGTGRARGLTVFGPAAAGDVLRQAIASFRDLGVLGAAAARTRGTLPAHGSSDYVAFNEAGLPGINVLQDPIQYDTYTWHSNLDTYERVVEEDAVKSAIVIAATVYHLAMREEPLPRFGSGDMPKRPGRGGGP